MTTPTMTPFRAGHSPGSLGPMAIQQFAGPHVLLADVSEFEPDIADATYLAWSKAIVIRCAYGDQHDDRAWYAGQRRAALHQGGARFLGIYQYLVAGQSGAAQAQAFHRIVGAPRPGEVLIADFEEGSRSTLTAWYNAMTSLYGLGIQPYLWTYSGLWFGEQQGVLPVQWLADYDAAEPVSPHRLWQFTSSYQVPGVGAADCSLFHGDIGQLAALAYQAPASPPPPPPADWTYGAPQLLTARGGHTSVALEWQAPAGAPVPPDHFLVYVYEGAATAGKLPVSSYPRTAHGLAWEGGGLKRGTEYVAHVVASGPGSTRVRPGTFASATFRTA